MLALHGEIRSHGPRTEQLQDAYTFFSGPHLPGHADTVAHLIDISHREEINVQLKARIFLNPRFVIQETAAGDDNRPGFYHFSYGEAEFFVLDSNEIEEELQPGGRQYEWLEERLSKSSAPWKIVCFHHTVYSSYYRAFYDGMPSVKGAGDIDSLILMFDDLGVDLVLNGHHHQYQRTHPLSNGAIDENGTVYIVSGGGGGNLSAFGPVRAPYAAHLYSGYHYLLISIDAESLNLRMYGIDGALRDQLTLER